MKRKKLIFVCTGNTCRSPMAELLLKDKIKKNKIKWWDVSSCGIHAELGSGISQNSAIVLKELGIASDKFAPKQLTQKLISASTLVICMTSSQKQMLEGCGNVVCVKDICGYDVPDPYGCGVEVYRATRDALSTSCDLIIKNYILPYKD
ncbi:MAG: low molecular weight protein arginine phosphatase [Clostridia bacterium]|nr:low molecular weight protein arginine phosphatase [Clostridia bacterium]